MWDLRQCMPTTQVGKPRFAENAVLVDWHLFSFLSSYKKQNVCRRREISPQVTPFSREGTVFFGLPSTTILKLYL